MLQVLGEVVLVLAVCFMTKLEIPLAARVCVMCTAFLLTFGVTLLLCVVTSEELYIDYALSQSRCSIFSKSLSLFDMLLAQCIRYGRDVGTRSVHRVLLHRCFVLRMRKSSQ